MKLLVYGTLRKGRCLHFLLGKSQLINQTKTTETYDVGTIKLFFIDVIEFFCGYIRKKTDDVYEYKKYYL